MWRVGGATGRPVIADCVRCEARFEYTYVHHVRTLCGKCRSPTYAPRVCAYCGELIPGRSQTGKIEFHCDAFCRRMNRGGNYRPLARCADCDMLLPGRPWGAAESSAGRGGPRRCTKCRAAKSLRRRLPREEVATRDATKKAKRVAMEIAAGGISRNAYVHLVALWKRRGRTCVWCGGLGETVDHVIPLSRGGNSFEGNLVPACRSCNSSRANRLVIEWKKRPTGGLTVRKWVTRRQLTPA